jgi:hypothetical protein
MSLWKKLFGHKDERAMRARTARLVTHEHLVSEEYINFQPCGSCERVHVEIVRKFTRTVALFRLLEPCECLNYRAGHIIGAQLTRDQSGHESWYEAGENEYAREYVDPAIIREISAATGIAYKLERDW